MSVHAQSDVRVASIGAAGAPGVLSGTHLDGYGDLVNQYAAQYQLDPNFFLAYVLWENAFMAENANYPVEAVANNNPFDILCVNARYNNGNGPHGGAEVCGDPSGNQFAIDCINPGNGWCYTRYPSLGIGVQAAFWQANVWYTRDNITPEWGPMLLIAGWGPGNVGPICTTASGYATQYPPGSAPPVCDPPYVYDPVSGGCILPPGAPAPTDNVSLAAIAAGVGLLGAALVYGRRFAFP